MHTALVLRPSYAREKVGESEKGLNEK